MLLRPQSSSPAYTSNISHLPSSIIMYVMFTNHSFVFSILWTLCSFGASFCVRMPLFSFDDVKTILISPTPAKRHVRSACRGAASTRSLSAPPCY